MIFFLSQHIKIIYRKEKNSTHVIYEYTAALMNTTMLNEYNVHKKQKNLKNNLTRKQKKKILK